MFASLTYRIVKKTWEVLANYGIITARCLSASMERVDSLPVPAIAPRTANPSARLSRILLPLYVSAGVAVCFAITSDQFLHWFLLPIVLCGAVIGADAMDWILGRTDLFDPAGLLGITGYYFLFVSPLMVVFWNHRLLYLPNQPDDYRDWLGGMAILNLLGLFVYRAVRKLVIARSTRKESRAPWLIDNKRFGIALLLTLAISVGLQTWVYVTYGGIAGYIGAYMAWLAGEDAFKGSGWLFSVSESFPILGLIGFAVVMRKNRIRPGWMLLAVTMTIFFALQMLFGGLRGSRGNTIWGLFWATGIIHFYLRPLPRKILFIGLPFLVLFMYFYGFYKDAGTNAAQALQGEEERTLLSERTKRNSEMLLLSDFSRADVQSFLLFRLITTPEAYSYAYGRTYLGALALLIPSSVWPDRPPSKVKWTTDAEYGEGAYGDGPVISSRIYGLQGETMLNFGPWLVPFSFSLLGLAVGVVRSATLGMVPHDSRWLLVPLWIIACILLLLNDSDVNLFYLVKIGALPALVVLLGSRKPR